MRTSKASIITIQSSSVCSEPESDIFPIGTHLIRGGEGIDAHETLFQGAIGRHVHGTMRIQRPSAWTHESHAKSGLPPARLQYSRLCPNNCENTRFGFSPQCKCPDFK
ncbi:hypothetical protein IG631_08524 [Alternaria alternata]|nr:hypothetical protein IG631_08524 [Alternaria alternata]